MRGERAQITLFVAVGLVLLLVVGVIFLLARPSAPAGAQEADAAVLSSYLGSCLDTIVTDELASFAASGGTPDFSGRLSARIDEGVADRDVLVALTPNADASPSGIKPFRSEPPWYPAAGIGIDNATLDNATGREFAAFQDGYFGDVNFPAVCSKHSMNRPGSTFTCRYYAGNPPGTRGIGAYDSAQELLERRIGQRVRACAAQRAFDEAIGTHVEVGEPAVNVTFTFDNTLVQLVYPLTVEGDSTVRLETFHRTYRVRYLALAQFAYDLAREEARNVTFRIDADAGNIPSFKEGMHVLRVRDIGMLAAPAGVAHADLITVIDANSEIDGESARFSFLVAHRPPMLELLTASQFSAAASGNPIAVRAADPDDGAVQVVVCHSAATDARCAGPLRNTVAAFDPDGERDWESIAAH
jgi:hypothetical protein